MKKLLIISFLIIPLLFFSQKKSKIIFSDKIVTKKFIYNFTSCPCAQWSLLDDKNKYPEKFFLIRENSKTPIAENLSDGNKIPFIIEVKGVFSENKSIPDDFPSKGDAEREKARFFKYHTIRVIQLGKKTF